MKDAVSILNKYKKGDEVFRLNIFLEYPDLRDEFIEIEMESSKDKAGNRKPDQKPPKIVDNFYGLIALPKKILSNFLHSYCKFHIKF